MEKHTSGDNAEVIDNRLKRLIQELLAHQQRCSHHATGKKKYLRRQKKPRHVRAESYLPSGKSGIGEADVGNG